MSYHYYAVHDSKDVVKLVVDSEDNAEIHMLSEHDGLFMLDHIILVKTEENGRQWLKSQGFTKIQQLVMKHVDYSYKNGVVGLYEINDIKSVILEYPPNQHSKIEFELGLYGFTQITEPYNKYLYQIGQSTILDL